MRKPAGLKLFPQLLSSTEIQEILSQQEYAPQHEAQTKLFRYFGDFGSLKTPEASDWMLRYGHKCVARGVFKTLPNQYRVCDWVSDLSAQFKWHIDSRRHGEDILAICLTPNRQIGFRDPAKSEIYILELDAGDAYLMRKGARWNLEHRVMPTGKEVGGGKSFIMSVR